MDKIFYIIAGILLIVAILTIILLPIFIYRWYYSDSSDKFQKINELRKSVTQIIGGLFFIITLLISFSSLKQNEQTQISNRLSDAIKLVGSDNINTRVSGLILLGRIAKDSKDDAGEVINILKSYIRYKSPNIIDTGLWKINKIKKEIIRHDTVETFIAEADIQTAFDMISVIKKNYQNTAYPLFVSDADIRGVDLTKADLQFIEFYRCRLEKINFEEALLDSSHFNSCLIKDCTFGKAILNNSIFLDCTFESSGFAKSNLDNVHFINPVMADSLIRRIGDCQMNDSTTIESGEIPRQSIRDYMQKKLNLLK